MKARRRALALLLAGAMVLTPTEPVNLRVQAAESEAGYQEEYTLSAGDAVTERTGIAQSGAEESGTTSGDDEKEPGADGNVSGGDASGGDVSGGNLPEDSTLLPEIAAVEETVGDSADSVGGTPESALSLGSEEAYFVNGASTQIDRLNVNGYEDPTEENKALYTAVHNDMQYEKQGGVFYAGHDVIRYNKNKDGVKVYDKANYQKLLDEETEETAQALESAPSFEDNTMIFTVNAMPAALHPDGAAWISRLTAQSGSDESLDVDEMKLYAWEYEASGSGSELAYTRVGVHEIAGEDYCFTEGFTEETEGGNRDDGYTVSGAVKLKGDWMKDPSDPVAIVARLYDAKEGHTISDFYWGSDEWQGGDASHVHDAPDYFSMWEHDTIYYWLTYAENMYYPSRFYYMDDMFGVKALGEFSLSAYNYWIDESAHKITLLNAAPYNSYAVVRGSWDNRNSGYLSGILRDESNTTQTIKSWVIPAMITLDDVPYNVALGGGNAGKYPVDAVRLTVKEGVQYPALAYGLFSHGNNVLVTYISDNTFAGGDVSFAYGFRSLVCQLTSVTLEGEKNSIKGIMNMCDMFIGNTPIYTEMTFDIGALDTSQVTNMSGMFAYNRLAAGEHLGDIEGFDTGKVTDMSGMFANVTVQDGTLAIGNLNTANVTTMASMFCELSVPSGAALPLSGFDTRKVESMYNMFGSVVSGDGTAFELGSFQTKNVTDMDCMFAAAGMDTIDVSDLDFGKVTTMNSMFAQTSASKIILPADMNSEQVTDMECLFYGAYALSEIENLTAMDTGNVTNMYAMFSTTLKERTVQAYDSLTGSNKVRIKQVKDYTFGPKIQSLDLSNFDMRKVKDARFMLCNTGLKEVKLGENFKLNAMDSNIDSYFVPRSPAYGMFAAPGVESLDLTYVDFPKLKKFDVVFGSLQSSVYPAKLSELTLGNMDLRSVEKGGMFNLSLPALTRLDLSGLKLNAYSLGEESFAGCTGLEEIIFPACPAFVSQVKLPDTFFDADGNTYEYFAGGNTEPLALTSALGDAVRGIYTDEDMLTLYANVVNESDGNYPVDGYFFVSMVLEDGTLAERKVSPAPQITWDVLTGEDVITTECFDNREKDAELKVRAKKPGEATIGLTVKMLDQTYEKTLRVTVTDYASFRTTVVEAGDGNSYYLQKIGDDAWAVTGLASLTGKTMDLTTIPSGYTVTRIADRAFAYNTYAYSSTEQEQQVADAMSDVTAVILPASLTEIGSGAFSTPSDASSTGKGFGYLKSVSFAEGSKLVRIGDYAFTGVGSGFDAENDETARFGITLPEGLKVIGASAFEESCLSEISIPDSVETLGRRCFYGCDYLARVRLSAGLAEIPEYLFYYCNRLGSIDNFANAMKNVTGIGTYAFYNTGADAETVTPVALTAGSCTWIGESAVACSRLVESFDGPKVKNMGNYAFTGFQGDNSPKNVLKKVSFSVLKEIPQGAFSGATALEEISFPQVIKIGDSAFSMGSTGRNASTLTMNPTILDTYAPVYLTGIQIPETVTYIGSSAFQYVDAPLVIPKGVVHIGSYAFNGCYGLTDVTIPASVTDMETYAFANCRNLKSFTFAGDPQTIPEGTFFECYHLNSAIIPDSVSTIGAKAFYYCGLKELKLPASLDTIGANAFNKAISGTKQFDSNYGTYGTVTEVEDGLDILEIPYGTTTISNNSAEGNAISVRDHYIRELWLPETLTSVAGVDVFQSITSTGLVYYEKKDGSYQAGTVYYGGSEEQFKKLFDLDESTWYGTAKNTYHYDIHFYSGWTEIDGERVFRIDGEIVGAGIRKIGDHWYDLDVKGNPVSMNIAVVRTEKNDEDETLRYVYYFDEYGRGDRALYTADGVYSLFDGTVSVLVKGGEVVTGTAYAGSGEGGISGMAAQAVKTGLATQDGEDYFPYVSGVLAKGYQTDVEENGYYFDDLAAKDGRLLWYRDAATGLYYSEASTSGEKLTGEYPDETGEIFSFRNGRKSALQTEDITITATPADLALYVNGDGTEANPSSGTLTASVKEGFEIDNISWSIVSNASRYKGRDVVTLGAETADDTVSVNANAAGSARIRATVTDTAGNTAYREVTVKVTDLTVVPTSVTVTAQGGATSVVAGENASLQLYATVLPENVKEEDKKVTWSLSLPGSVPVGYQGYFTIDENGKFTTSIPQWEFGSAYLNTDSVTLTVTATTKNLVTGTYKITVLAKAQGGEEPGPGPDPEPVDIAATGVVLNQTVAQLYPGESLKLSATVSPANAADKSLSWEVDSTSEDPAAVSVDENGKVTAVYAGKAVVTVTAKGNNKVQAQCVITVLESEVEETDENGNPIDPGAISTLLEEAKEDGKISGDQPIWVGGLQNTYYYTGNAVKPSIHVYKGHKLLAEKTDYTLSYKNNKNVSTGISDNKKKPQIVIKLKGSYSGSETVYFEIVPMPLDKLTADDLTVAYKAGKKNQLKPVLMYSGAETGWQDTKIKYSAKDITFTWSDDDGEGNSANGSGSNASGSLCDKPGEYAVVISAGASGNFTVSDDAGSTAGGDNVEIVTLTDGTKAVQIATLTVTELVPMSSVKLTGFKASLPYSGKNTDGEVQEVKQNAVLKYSNIELKVAEEGDPDAADADCIVTYENNTGIGVATVIYTGTEREGTENKPIFTGQLKKTFKITGKYTIEASDVSFKYADENGDYKTSYTGLAIKPEVKVVVDGRTLKAGTDYTVTYKNNKAVAGKNETDTKGRSKAPQIIVKGKGNYQTAEKTGITKTFTITKCNLNDLVLTVADKAYNKKANAYKSTKITFADGNYRDMKLKAGKDYTITVDGILDNTSGSDDVPAAGSVVKMTITGTGANFEGTVTGSYRITDTQATPDISKAKAVVGGGKACAYTGSAIEPHDKAWLTAEGITGGAGTSNPVLEVTMKAGKETITLHETAQDAAGAKQPGQYEILGYYNNVNKGTAYVLIRGINGYSGIRAVKFKIAASDVKNSWGGVYNAGSGTLEK